MAADEQAAATPSSGVIWFELYADDVERAGGFYRRVFGWTTRPFLDYDPTGGYLLLSYAPHTRAAGAIVRRETPHEAAPAGRGCVLYVEVADLATAADAVERAGGRLVEDVRVIGPDDGFFSLVSDTEGNLLGLWAAERRG